MKRSVCALTACVGAFAFATSVHGAQNNTAAGAVSYEVGAGWVTDGVDVNNQTRWFIFTEFASRSYCVEASLGPATYNPLDPLVTLYSDLSGNTVYLSNNDGTGDAPQYKGSRVCYQSALAVGTTTPRLFNVNLSISGTDSGFVRVRVVDTTLVFPELCLQNDSTGAASRSVNLFIANTTTININATVIVPGYGAVKTHTGGNVLKAPNRSTNSGNLVEDTVTAPSGLVNWSWDGAVFLTHDGPPGALESWADTNDNCRNSAVVRTYAYPR